MERFDYHYPGDPVMECLVMTRIEFLERYPRCPIEIRNFDTEELIEKIPVPLDAIYCDLCNTDPGDKIYVHSGGSYAYCHACAGVSILPSRI